MFISKAEDVDSTAKGPAGSGYWPSYIEKEGPASSSPTAHEGLPDADDEDGSSYRDSDNENKNCDYYSNDDVEANLSVSGS
jgi:hypothetical protein